MVRLVRAATDRNPPTSGGGGCQSIEKIATPEYPEGINAYHVDVIPAFRCELAQNPGMLDRYRKRRAA